MTHVTREQLRDYLIEAIGEAESARIEKALRDSPELRRVLEEVRAEVGPSEHSLGTIWREGRLTCPSRDELGAFLMGGLEPAYQGYVGFHLKSIGCPFCLANLEDLEARRSEDVKIADQRRRRLFEAVHSRIVREDPPIGRK